MNPTPEPIPLPAAPPPKKRRGVFAFLFKTALGCTSFALGALVALVLLLPTLSGGLVARIASQGFADRYRGKLEIGGVNLAWFRAQTIENAVVRDPEGNIVARASATLPSLLGLIQGGTTKIGHVTLAVDADLVQDEHGVTNLQRALEPREKKAPEKKRTPDDEPFDPIKWLAELELDLDVRSKKLSWSDAETRRAGAPFEVHDLVATVHAKPRDPVKVHVEGRVVSDQPSPMVLDVVLHGPITPGAAWPFGKTDVQARVEGFSTAMIDGIASLNGNLVEVLGRKFTLRADASNATPDAGDLKVALESERAHVEVIGQFKDGALRSTDKPGVVARMPAPTGFLAKFLEARVPPGSKVAVVDAGAPWTLEVKRFVVPLSADMAKTELELAADLPSKVTFENESTRKSGRTLSIGAVRADALVKPGAPARVHLEAAIDAGAPGHLRVDASANDVWAKLAQKTIPPVDLEAELTGLSPGALGAFADQGERLELAFGRTLDVKLVARGASLEGGAIELTASGRDTKERFKLDASARIEAGVLRASGDDKIRLEWSDPAMWIAHELQAAMRPPVEVTPAAGPITIEVRDLAVPLPDPKVPDHLAVLESKASGVVEVHFPGATYVDEALRAARTSVTIGAISAEARLEPRGALKASVRGDVAQPNAKGQLSADVSTVNAWAFARKDAQAAPPPIEAEIAVKNVPTGLVDALAKQDGRVTRLLGDKLSVSLIARNASARSGTLKLQLNSPGLLLEFGGKLENGQLVARGEDDLHALLKVAPAAIAPDLAAVLPEGTTLTWPDGAVEARFEIKELALPVPELGSGKKYDVYAALRKANAKAVLTIPSVGVANETTRAAKMDVALREISVDARIAPGAPFVVQIGASVAAGRVGRLDVLATMHEAWRALEKSEMPAVDAHAKLVGFDGSVIDAIRGKKDDFGLLLGSDLALTLDTRNASLTGGEYKLDVKSETTTLRVAARIDKDGLVCTGDEGVDLTIALKPAYLEARTRDALPKGAKLALASGAAPLIARIRDVRVPLPRADAPPLLERVSTMAMKLDATFPALVYTDAATDAASKPIGIADGKLEARLAPSALPQATLSARVVDDPPGEIKVDVSALDPLSKLAETDGVDTWRAKVEVRATKVPTAIIDLIAKQDGLWTEALGARVEVTVKAPEISMSKGPFIAEFRSELHRVHAEGRIAERAIVVDKIDGLTAKIGLGPLMSQRVVGRLVPMLFDVEKPADATPALFSVDKLAYPLDGDLSKLDAIVRIELGRVSYRFLPGLEQYVGDLAVMKNVEVPALRVPIQKGIASYDKLPIKIRGHELLFNGTFNLANQQLSLATEIPLEILGKTVNAKLEGVRDVLDPKMKVPIEIRGTWKKPSVSIGKDFLDKALEGAAKRGLEGLLDGLGKKKKKD